LPTGPGRTYRRTEPEGRETERCYGRGPSPPPGSNRRRGHPGLASARRGPKVHAAGRSVSQAPDAIPTLPRAVGGRDSLAMSHTTATRSLRPASGPDPHMRPRGGRMTTRMPPARATTARSARLMVACKNGSAIGRQADSGVRQTRAALGRRTAAGRKAWPTVQDTHRGPASWGIAGPRVRPRGDGRSGPAAPGPRGERHRRISVVRRHWAVPHRMAPAVGPVSTYSNG
jgi:hypothetical protein